ncbi:MAG: amidohydrolase [Thermoplasmata archaeon]|nr:MAG: amidohydrolase [Thermoplasmata archaeon]
MSILIKGVLLCAPNKHGLVDIYIEDNTIVEVSSAGKINVEAEHVVDGSNHIAFAGLINAHTHAAMTLFRGYADDLPLHEWLTNKIWPLEARLDAETVYWATRLACIEMIRTGTTTFNDMYFFMEDVAKAVRDSGIRAVLSYGFIDLFDEEKREVEIKRTENFVRFVEGLGCSRVKAAVGPHAIYTVSRDGLIWAKEYADEKGLILHIHLSETKKEVEECQKEYGESPVKYLDSIGFLGKNVVAAHAVWVSDNDAQILGRRGVSIAHCPVSNMKLGVGRAMPYQTLRNVGVNIALGTDGCASNNNLDMIEEMKVAALLHKMSGDPTVLNAHEALAMGSVNGAIALGINSGRIEEGAVADIVLMDTRSSRHVPGYNAISDLVYSSTAAQIDTVICDGRFVMKNGVIESEAEVLDKVKKLAFDLVGRESN